MRPIALIRAFASAFDLAKENRRLRREVAHLQSSLARIDRERTYWMAYQRQTSLEAMRAQEIMVAKIDDQRRKLGDPDDASWIDHLQKWKKVRVEGVGAHPFAQSFGDVSPESHDSEGGAPPIPDLDR